MTTINHRIELIKLLPPHSCVAEVGVAEGLFSRDLLEAGVERLYMIDNWGHIPGVTGDGSFPSEWHDKNYYDAVNRVQPYGWRAKMLRGLSTTMAASIEDNSLDMVYLDAAHYYDGVLADLKVYYPKVKPGGIIAGHDYLNPDYGVKQAVHDFIRHYLKKDMIVGVIQENNPEDASFYFIKPINP